MNTNLKLIVINEKSFHNAWVKLVKNIIRHGTLLRTDYDNKAMTATSVINLCGNAIKEIENFEIHPQFPTKEKHLEKYVEQFVSDDNYGFEYTYYDRFKEDDQLVNLKKRINENTIGSRRLQVISWHHDDILKLYPPCLNKIQLIKLDGKNISMHLDFRSRDCFNAYQSNIIGVTHMINKKVLESSNMVISQIIDRISAAHIYEYDIEYAKNLKLVQTNPQYNYL